MEKVSLICIGCPLGCPLEAEMDKGQVLTVSGHTCKNGEKYARKELTAPTRIVTTTVKVLGGTLPAVSVKTATDIPKAKLFDCVKALKDLVLQAPVEIGAVVLADVAGTGVDIVATKTVEMVEKGG